MKPLSILLLLAAPLPAFAQAAPTTHDEAQRIVRAEAERWRYPLVEEDGSRYPEIIGKIVTHDAQRCSTHYTISFPAFTTADGTPHGAVIRQVDMRWALSQRHAIVNGSVVTLTWFARRDGGRYTWDLETDTPERAEAFAAAADFLTDLCTNEDDGDDGKSVAK